MTVLGGLLLAGAGSYFQHVSAVNQHELQYQRQVLDKKFALLSSFTTHFERDMSLLYNIRSLELVANEARKGNARAKHLWDEEKPRFEKLVEEHAKGHRELGTLLEVTSRHSSNPCLTNHSDRISPDLRFPSIVDGCHCVAVESDPRRHCGSCSRCYE